MFAEEIMFSILRSEICGEDLKDNLKNELFSDILKQLYVLSQKHDISHIIAFALSKMGVLQNDKVSECFKKQLMVSIYRNEQNEYAIEQTGLILEKSEIPYILLKGAVVRKYYPHSWMRTSCDVDILIRKEDAEASINALCAAGYARSNDSSTHDYSFITPSNVHIELHYTLAQKEKLSSADNVLETVWEHVTLNEGSSFCYSMDYKMFVLYHLAHMGRHLIYGGCGVRPFIDLWLINKQYPIEELTEVHTMLKKCNLLALYDTSLELSKVWFENYKHNEKTEQLEKYILCGGVYGSTANAARVEAARGVGKLHSFFNLMFLPKENLEVLYPNLKKHPFLYPFYQIKRWFKCFDKNKCHKVKYLVKQRNAVTTEEMNHTADLLNQLGLI